MHGLLLTMQRHYEADSLLSRTKALLHHYVLRARKRLGQHFLVDEEVLQDILEAAQLKKSDIVVEVGPGLGVLTRELAKQAGWVIAVELDDNLADLLEKDLASFGNIAIINKDILEIAPSDLLKEAGERFPDITVVSSYKLVANLPYYITAPVLRHFLEDPVRPETMVIMVQKEVAECIVAGPGDMSILSVSVQFYGQPEIVRYVPAACFYPAPEVDSAVLRITPHAQPPVPVTDEKSFFETVRAGFAAPRKQLSNSLSKGMDIEKDKATSLLKSADIDPHRRAETLTLDEWARLWEKSTQAGKSSADSTSTG